MNLKNGKVFTSKFVRTGPSSYERRIYRTAVSQTLRNTGLNWSWYSLLLRNTVVLYRVHKIVTFFPLREVALAHLSFNVTFLLHVGLLA